MVRQGGGDLDEISFRIFRFDPSRDAEARYQLYRIRPEPGLTVLSALVSLREEQDGSLAFRASCRSGICGSDAMLINGRARLACKTQVAEAAGDGTVTLEPLRGFPVLKDLVVDQSDFWEKLVRVKPWLIPGPEPAPERERLMRLPAQQFDELSRASDCIFCACCYAECPMEGRHRAYLGPAALVKAYRFEADPRDAGSAERRGALDQPDGVWRCHHVFRCTEACPKEIDAAWAIQQLQRRLAARHLRLKGDA